MTDFRLVGRSHAASIYVVEGPEATDCTDEWSEVFKVAARCGWPATVSHWVKVSSGTRVPALEWNLRGRWTEFGPEGARAERDHIVVCVYVDPELPDRG